jgi:hypothetical protein
MGKVASKPASVDSVDVVVPQTKEFVPDCGLWVRLRDRPSDYAADSALLVCPVEEDVWIAWVPDYGEMVLPRSQFYRMGESAA